MAATLLAMPALHAKTFKWSSASDIPTLDIHSQNDALGNAVHAPIYDSLVYYNSKTFEAEPPLATGWKLMSPTQMRFSVRSGVKFSEAREGRDRSLKVRNELIEKALILSHEDVAYLPLHNQIIPWAMRKNIEVVHRADNRLDWRLIKVN